MLNMLLIRNGSIIMYSRITFYDVDLIHHTNNLLMCNLFYRIFLWKFRLRRFSYNLFWSFNNIVSSHLRRCCKSFTYVILIAWYQCCFPFLHLEFHLLHVWLSHVTVFIQILFTWWDDFIFILDSLSEALLRSQVRMSWQNTVYLGLPVQT